MNKLFRRIFTAVLGDYPKRLTYIWQSSEYGSNKFIPWWSRLSNFNSFSIRGDLVKTKASTILRILITLIALGYWLLVAILIYFNKNNPAISVVVLIAGLIFYHIIVAILSILVVYILRKFYSEPLDAIKIRKARKIFKSHSGIVIAVAGSYGKTTVKELLTNILSISKKVAFTPGNRNVLSSQADLAIKLKGDEDIIIVEFGESSPGDIKAMTELCDPDYAVLTGVAPNHLDNYKTIDAIVEDFKYLVEKVGAEYSYLNFDNKTIQENFSGLGIPYSADGLGGRSVKDIKIGADSLSFKIKNKTNSVELKSKLIGRHNIASLLLGFVLASKLGVEEKRLVETIGSVQPYEHRMSPRELNGAIVIDDTYNGNIEGMRAGLKYLSEISVRGKKYYATPGLVEQGSKNEEVHKELGRLMAESNPDSVYIMKNEVTNIILESLKANNYKGSVKVISDPLSFYQNIGDILASGDIILCQNDWPDIYN